jgi:2-polyprenyl-3-methyl-5-hydroxy-6-metoxy-1,4-benzoquinol methylase
MYSVSVCPICGSKAFNNFVSCVDHTVSHETFNIVKCKNCALLITSPRPENDQLSKYYASEDYISHSDDARTIVDLIYKTSRVFTLKWKYHLIKKHATKKSPLTILDYGCGTGDFLKNCLAQGNIVEGVEPSDKARVIARTSTGANISSVLDDTRASFDVITLWHVLEHVPELNEIVSKLSTALAKNGTMFIAVPNHESADASKYNSNWAGYDVPRHLWHFSRNNMNLLLQNNGLELTEIIPMKLDAFYVSIMSEKSRGKNGLSALVKGMLSGLTSNLKAGDKNYSSLIYIARKKNEIQ